MVELLVNRTDQKSSQGELLFHDSKQRREAYELLRTIKMAWRAKQIKAITTQNNKFFQDSIPINNSVSTYVFSFDVIPIALIFDTKSF